MSRKTTLLIMIFTLLLAACGQTTPPIQTPVATPTPPQPPDPGMATATGRVVNAEGEFLPGVIVRLAEVVRGVEGNGGAFILDVAHSPSSFTDAAGYFIFSNIKGAEYVIVIGDVEITGIYEIIPQEDGKARVFNMPADQVTDVGNITTTIEPPQLLPGINLTPASAPTESGVYPEPVFLPTSPPPQTYP
jgi:hypothetical protein